MAPVKLRLLRWGVRHEPFFGIVAAKKIRPEVNYRPARKPVPKYKIKDIDPTIERLGTYNATPDKNGVLHIELNVERIKHWLGQGAEPTDRVAWLLAKAGLLPQPPKFLQKSGHLSLHDPKTWDVELRDAEGKILGQITAEEARTYLSDPDLADQLPRDHPVIPPEPSPFALNNVELDGTPPGGALSDVERLHILKRYLGLRA
ncbi:37S ribosomal protein S16, mitochondrial [Rhizophlyctis rosea]|nr:37S ribosomal protein S16, mitochondrial [Rhizophlyctis rosea]